MKALKTAAAFLPLAFAISFPISAFSQSCRFSVGPLASVDTYQPEADELSLSRGEISDNTKYSLGVGVSYQAQSGFVLKTGVLYSDKGYTSVHKRSDSGRFASDVYFHPDQRQVKTNYLDVPLIMGYRVVQRGKFSVVPALGLVTSFHLSSTFIDTYYHPLNPEGFSKTYPIENTEILMAAAFEIGINYQVANRIQLGLSPYYRAGLNIANDIPFQQNPSSFGTSLELRYCLK